MHPRNHDQKLFAVLQRKFGLSEEDIISSQILFSEIPPPPPPNCASASKVEKVLGYSNLRLNREKALKRLGVSEEDVDIENSKNLGSLGLAGRKRSYSIHREESDSSNRKSRRKQSRKNSKLRKLSLPRSFMITKCSNKRQKSETISRKDEEVSVMMKHFIDMQVEMIQLKKRVKYLEDKLKTKNES